MLIIDAREQDSIDRALKVYKKKYEKAGIIKKLHAVYIEQLRKSED